MLVANRGEIARRVIATARRMGIRAVAVYSEADAELPYVREADEAVLIGPPPPARSYLDAAAILRAAGWRVVSVDASTPLAAAWQQLATFPSAPGHLDSASNVSGAMP